MEIGQLIVALAANASEYAKGLAEANKMTRSWADQVTGTAAQGFAGLQGTVRAGMLGAAGLLAGGVATIGAGLATAGAAAFDVSRQVEEAGASMAASLGRPIEEVERFAEVARQVYGNNFADSVTGAGEVVATAVKMMGDVSDQELQRITEQALAIADSFGTETSESLSAARTLMDEFGLSSDQAFDFIARGYQQGLDRSGDFLDSITEYATQFSEAEADAGQFFSVLASGLTGGMLGTDKAADLFKEFRVRLLDGSDTTAAALAGIFGTPDMAGLIEYQGGVEAFFSDIRSGAVSSTDAFGLVQQAIGQVDDPIQRMQLGVALMGTQFEDLGDSAVLAIDLASTSIEDLTGAADSLNAKYSTFGSMFAALWRRSVVTISPVTDRVLAMANEAFPAVERGVDLATTAVAALFDFVLGGDIQPFGDALRAALPAEFANAISDAVVGVSLLFDALGGGGLESLQLFMSEVGFGTAAIDEFAGWLLEVVPAVQAFVAPITEAISSFVSWQDVMAALALVAASIVIPALAGIVAGAAPVIAVAAAIVAGVALLRNAWESDFGGMRTALTQFWSGSVKPALSEAVDWLRERLPGAISTLQGWWEDRLLPALRSTSAFIQEHMLPLFGSLARLGLAVVEFQIMTLVAVVENFLLPALRTAWGFIRDHIIPIFGGMSDSIGGIGGAIQSVIGWVNSLTSALNNAADRIPDLFKPGSPTPFEIGFRGIADAMLAADAAARRVDLRVDGGLPTVSRETVGRGGEEAERRRGEEALTTDPLSVDVPRIEPLSVDAPRLEPLSVDVPRLEPLSVDVPRIEPLPVDVPRLEMLSVDMLVANTLESALRGLDRLRTVDNGDQVSVISSDLRSLSESLRVMDVAQVDGGRQTADGGRQTADGGSQTTTNHVTINITASNAEQARNGVLSALRAAGMYA